MADENSDSILKTIRKMIGPEEDYTYFDTELIININSAFSRLCQLGVGNTAPTPFKITGEEEEWSDFIDDGYQEEVKTYVFLKTKLIFDPPSNGTVINVYKEEIDRLEWLLKEVAADGY